MFDPMEEIIAALQRGEPVVVTDDENRENEGDLIAVGELADADVINLMASQGRGLICVALEAERLAELGVARMPTRGQGDKHQTAFMESVDAARYVTTGISAADRADAVRLLVGPEGTREDLVSPGHLFPLEARAGGVLARAGHTETAVDLARLAGFRPAGVICEILRDDGEMARLPELREFAAKHGLKMTSVEELIAHRRRTEKLVEYERTVALHCG